jgi:YidC/Oxa1 family membrane protein insertase
MNEQKNLILAVALVVAILFGFNYFYERPKALEYQQKVELSQAQGKNAPSSGNGAATLTSKVVTQLDRGEAIKVSKRISINTPKFKGSVNLQGGMIDDLQLLD